MAKGFDKKVLSPASFAARLNLSQAAQKALQAEMPSPLFNQQFTFMTGELDKIIAFKTVDIDNGATLSAPTAEFDNVFEKKSVRGKTSYTTVGKVINEKLRKTK